MLRLGQVRPVTVSVIRAVLTHRRVTRRCKAKRLNVHGLEAAVGVLEVRLGGQSKYTLKRIAFHRRVTVLNVNRPLERI